MILEELQPASYRGAFFFVEGIDTAGGRKNSLKEIVNSDLQSVEDLGLKQRTFTVRGVVAASVRSTLLPDSASGYKQARDSLLAALEQGGTGQFVHPFFGTIENVTCQTFSLNESLSSVGSSPISITFAISNTDGVPVAEEAVLGTVDSAANAGKLALRESVSDLYRVQEAFAGNFQDAIAQVEDFTDAVLATTDPLVQVADEIDSFAASVSEAAATAASLVDDPQALSESIFSIVNSTNGLLATPEGIFDSMKRLFDFGDLDIRFTTDTAGAKQRQANRDLLNNQVQGHALCQAYSSATLLNLPTVEDIDAISTVLEDQFQKMIAEGTLESDAQEGITITRIALTSFFNAQRADKPRLIEVSTFTTPARVLSYQYYGTSAQGDEIAERNNLNDSAFLEGDVLILSS